MFSGLPPKADLPPDLRTTPAVNSERTLPSPPRAAARSRALACGPHDVQRGHVSLLVPNLPRQLARIRSLRREIRALNETPPQRHSRSLNPDGRSARTTTRRSALNVRGRRPPCA